MKTKDEIKQLIVESVIAHGGKNVPIDEVAKDVSLKCQLKYNEIIDLIHKMANNKKGPIHYGTTNNEKDITVSINDEEADPVPDDEKSQSKDKKISERLTQSKPVPLPPNQNPHRK